MFGEQTPKVPTVAVDGKDAAALLAKLDIAQGADWNDADLVGKKSKAQVRIKAKPYSEELDAKNIVARLQKGEKFEELAKQSKDPGNKDRGGDLGWSAPSGYVKPFADAMVALEKGKFSATPVNTQFGWHVIQLDDVRDLKHPPLEEVKPQIQQRLQQQILEKHITELRAKAKIE